MKKGLLTLALTAMFCIGANAQEQQCKHNCAKEGEKTCQQKCDKQGDKPCCKRDSMKCCKAGMGDSCAMKREKIHCKMPAVPRVGERCDKTGEGQPCCQASGKKGEMGKNRGERLAKEFGLSEKDSKKFIELYNDYQDDIKGIFKKNMKCDKDKKDRKTQTVEERLDRQEKMNEARQAVTKTQKKYYSKFKKMLTDEQIQRVYATGRPGNRQGQHNGSHGNGQGQHMQHKGGQHGQRPMHQQNKQEQGKPCPHAQGQTCPNGKDAAKQCPHAGKGAQVCPHSAEAATTAK